MEILFVSTELAPFVKVGGLADVAAALPKALRGLGHRVTIVLPRFPQLEEGGLLMARRLTPLKFNLGGKAVEVTVYVRGEWRDEEVIEPFMTRFYLPVGGEQPAKTQ